MRELLPIIAISLALFVGYRLGKNTADEWYAKHPMGLCQTYAKDYANLNGPETPIWVECKDK